MPTYLNPNSILDNSITKAKLTNEFQTEIDGNTLVIAVEQGLTYETYVGKNTSGTLVTKNLFD